jgi:hypothetical protein
MPPPKNETFMNKNQSNSYGDLTENKRHQFDNNMNTVKRNKTFWRFSKSEDILEGMSLWKHIDLLPIDGDENTLKKLPQLQQQQTSNYHHQQAQQSIEQPQKKHSVLNKPSTAFNGKENGSGNKMMTMENARDGKSQEKHMVTDQPYNDDDIYDLTPKRRNYNAQQPSQHQQQPQNHHHDMNGAGNEPNEWRRNRTGPINLHNERNSSLYKEIQDTNFYDDDEILLRTVKRKEILKQYYSSETDTEVSINSDPYDCIVVSNHHDFDSTLSSSKKNINSNSNISKMNSLQKLPRTKLLKSKNSIDGENTLKSTTTTSTSKKHKSVEPWSNLWKE